MICRKCGIIVSESDASKGDLLCGTCRQRILTIMRGGPK